MNIDKNFSNKDGYINNIGLISPINLDESNELLDLFEHRGKPDPANVRKREEQRRRGELRRKNAEKRRAEAEKRKTKKIKTKISEKEKKSETPKQEPLKKISGKEDDKKDVKLSNKKIQEVKDHISDSKEGCKKAIKGIKIKNDHQKNIVKDIENSIDFISNEIEDNMNNGKDVEIDDILDREYNKIVKKHKDIKIEREDDWGDLGTLNDKEESFAKQFDKNWDFQEKPIKNKKQSLEDWNNSQDDDYDGENNYKKSYYQLKLQKLQKRYENDIEKYSDDKERLKEIKTKYKEDKNRINQRIKETEIEDWEGYKEKRNQQKAKRKEELRKNPVINWIRMTYFKTLYPLYNAKEKISKAINWLYGFDD